MKFSSVLVTGVVTGEGIIHILEWIPENIIFQLYDLFDRG